MVIFEYTQDYIYLHNDTIMDCIYNDFLHPTVYPMIICSDATYHLINIIALIVLTTILIVFLYFMFRYEKKEKEKEQNVTNEVKQNGNDQTKG